MGKPGKKKELEIVVVVVRVLLVVLRVTVLPPCSYTFSRPESPCARANDHMSIVHAVGKDRPKRAAPAAAAALTITITTVSSTNSSIGAFVVMVTMIVMMAVLPAAVLAFATPPLFLSVLLQSRVA